VRGVPRNSDENFMKNAPRGRLLVERSEAVARPRFAIDTDLTRPLNP
jgi:hypothetical protein